MHGSSRRANTISGSLEQDAAVRPRAATRGCRSASLVPLDRARPRPRSPAPEDALEEWDRSSAVLLRLSEPGVRASACPAGVGGMSAERSILIFRTPAPAILAAGASASGLPCSGSRDESRRPPSAAATPHEAVLALLLGRAPAPCCAVGDRVPGAAVLAWSLGSGAIAGAKSPLEGPLHGHDRGIQESGEVAGPPAFLGVRHAEDVVL